MEEGIPARLTPGEGRKFAFTVGGAFAGLGLLAWYRNHAGAAAVLGGIGLVLFLAGFAVPARLGPVRRAWMGAAHGISRVTTPIFMGLVYFGVITPTGLVMRALGRNPLVHAEADGGFWTARAPGARRSQSMERQF